MQTKILRKSFRDEKHILALVMTIKFSHYSFFQLLERKDSWSSHQIVDIPTFCIMGKTISIPIFLQYELKILEYD